MAKSNVDLGGVLCMADQCSCRAVMLLHIVLSKRALVCSTLRIVQQETVIWILVMYICGSTHKILVAENATEA